MLSRNAVIAQEFRAFFEEEKPRNGNGQYIENPHYADRKPEVRREKRDDQQEPRERRKHETPPYVDRLERYRRQAGCHESAYEKKHEYPDNGRRAPLAAERNDRRR